MGIIKKFKHCNIPCKAIVFLYSGYRQAFPRMGGRHRGLNIEMERTVLASIGGLARNTGKRTRTNISPRKSSASSVWVSGDPSHTFSSGNSKDAACAATGTIANSIRRSRKT
jgi:hypothetical protein